MDSKNVNFSSILDVIRLYNYNINVKMMSNVKIKCEFYLIYLT